MSCDEFEMMSRWSDTRLPWRDRSVPVGMSALLLTLAATKEDMPTWKRQFAAAQGIISFLSDYVYSGVPHWSHGLDRWTIKLLALLHARRAMAKHTALLPTCFYILSMKAIAHRNKAAYHLWHTLWHVFGALSIYL